MKRNLFFALLIAVTFCLSTKAQTATDSTQVQITLKARHHAYLIAFMGDRGSVDRIRYINQVVSQLNDSIDREQQIIVSVSPLLVKELFISVGNQPERLTTVYNAEIKQALLAQLQPYPELLSVIATITQKNSAETEQMVMNGFSFLQAIKQ